MFAIGGVAPNGNPHAPLEDGVIGEEAVRGDGEQREGAEEKEEEETEGMFNRGR